MAPTWGGASRAADAAHEGGVMAVTWNAENSAHLLSRAGFGGDIKEVEK